MTKKSEKGLKLDMFIYMIQFCIYTHTYHTDLYTGFCTKFKYTEDRRCS